MRRGAGWIAVALCLIATRADAQTAAPADRSRLWIVAGGASTTMRGDCQECEEPGPYLHTGSIFADIGRRMNDKMDAGIEILWVPSKAQSGSRIRSTSLMAAAQFRPWQSRGFFVKVGMGMTFVRNWVYDGSGENPLITSKALGLTYGAGWGFRRQARAGLQIVGTQHVAALGDFQTSAGTVENVVGNFWSLGAAIVIR